MRPSISSRRAWRSIEFEYSIEPLMIGIDRKIVAAVNALERCGAWPEGVHRFQIRISDGGQFDTSFGSHAREWGDESESFSPSHRRIVIGRDFLATTAPSALIAAGISPDVALALALGHETFHMTEIERQSECQVPFKSVTSGFARAICKEMSADWRSLAVDLAAHYRFHARTKEKFKQAMSKEALAANDAVSEGCADLIGLEIVAAVFGPIAGLDAAVADARSSAGQALDQYQCGPFLQGFIASKTTRSLENFVVKSWEHARDQLLLAPDCPEAITGRLRAISFQFANALPDLKLRALNPAPTQLAHRTAQKNRL